MGEYQVKTWAKTTLNKPELKQTNSYAREDQKKNKTVSKFNKDENCRA